MDTPPPHTSLVPVVPSTSLDPPSAAARLVSVFLSSKSASTLRSYRQDLTDFARFAGGAGPEDAARLLLAGGQGAANEVALRFRADLLERGLSPATVNRRLAALRSLVKLARTLGQVPWVLEIAGVKSESYRNTKGPGKANFARMLGAVSGSPEKVLRDRALLRLLHDLGLRRAEAVGLDLADYDAKAGTVAILGKGRTQKETLTLPLPTARILDAWLSARPQTDSPALFVALDRHARGGRLTGSGVYRVVRGLGEKVGVRTRPHGLRHLSISTLLQLTNGNVSECQRFSRHKSVAVLMTYNDNLKDDAGRLASLLADDLGNQV